MQRYCSKCGAAIAPDGGFCARCGAPVRPEPEQSRQTPGVPAPVQGYGASQFVCPRCGTGVGAGKRFCPRCGTPVQAASAVPP